MSKRIATKLKSASAATVLAVAGLAAATVSAPSASAATC